MDRGGYERQVGEGLGEVAQSLAGVTYFLGVETQMVGVGEHLLQGEARFIESSRLREALDEPERAQAEVALAPFEAVRSCVLRPVTLHERVVGQFLVDTVECGDSTWVHGADELDQWHLEQRGVEPERVEGNRRRVVLGLRAIARLRAMRQVDGVGVGGMSRTPAPASAGAGGMGCVGVQNVGQRARKVMMPRTGS